MHNPATVLVVDDEESVRNPVARYLTGLGYIVHLAATGEEALLHLKRRRPACVLLDVNLPDVNGVDLLASLTEADPTVAVVMLSALADARTAVLCMQRGVVDYVVKPFEIAALGHAVEAALTSREETLASQQAKQWLYEEVEQRNRDIAEERVKLERLAGTALEALVNAMEAKDPYLAGHSIRVAQLGASLAAQMGRSDEEVEQVRLAGRLHDIGMIAISGRILSKSGPLTTEEWEQVRQHPVVGFRTLAGYPQLEMVARFIRGHHERWDGLGYPDGLVGERIPWGARVLAAAEIYDAMTSARPYREKLSPTAARDRMRQLVGEVLDPAVFEALAVCVSRRQTLEFVHDGHGPDGEMGLAPRTTETAAGVPS